jgi:4a-hydroxytetrahydrobiopterin dehydratase
MQPMNEREIQKALGDLSGWSYTNQTLTKTFTLTDFAQAIALVNGAAEIAEEQGHHPDMDIRYNRVTFTLATHDAGSAVTSKDVTLAQAIEEQARLEQSH